MEKFECTEKRVPVPLPVLIYKISMMSKVWNISIGHLGLLPGHTPSQLLHTCPLAKHGKLKKVLDFLATAENISVLSTFLSY